jgi:hypothetical protein
MSYIKTSINIEIKIPKNIASKILTKRLEHVACLYFSLSSIDNSKILRNYNSTKSISSLATYTGYNPKVLRNKIKQLVEMGWAFYEGKSLRLISLKSFWSYFNPEDDYSSYSSYRLPVTDAKCIKSLIHYCALNDIQNKFNPDVMENEGSRGSNSECNTVSSLSISQRIISQNVFYKSKSQVSYHCYLLKDLGYIDVKRNNPIKLGLSLSTYDRKRERFTKDLELEDWREKKNRNKVFNADDIIVMGVPNTIRFKV